MKTDLHSHSDFSPDGTEPLAAMVKRAEALRLTFYGISEHFDYDYVADGIPFENGEPPRLTDADAYFQTARTLQKSAKLHFLVGGEFGFTQNPKAAEPYLRLIETYRPDFVINSVHTQGKFDYYDREAHASVPKKALYEEYLRLVLLSLNAPYPYDIVGHLGYCTRYVSYADPALRYADHREILDRIFDEIVARDKILEVNTSSPSFLPGRELLETYFRRGGRKISFASDAHASARIAHGWEEVVPILRKIGFQGVTVPDRGEHVFLPFDE